jgi:hypothetical protein
VEYVHPAKLFISHGKNSNLTVWWYAGLSSPHVDYGIFVAGTVPRIYRILEHCITVIQ